MRISDWSSDVCSADLPAAGHPAHVAAAVDLAPGRRLRRVRALDAAADPDLLHLLRAAGVRHHAGGADRGRAGARPALRSDEHTSELQSLMRISYAVFCLKNKM